MEKYIIIILVIILIIYLLNKNKNNENENLTLSEEQYDKLSSVTEKYVGDIVTELPNIIVSGNINVGKYKFQDLINNFKYPIGCYYTQYPDSNVNLNTKRDVVITPFPEEKTPAKLFGGEWVAMWSNESVYFRTGKDNTVAYESDSREDGFQDYALKKITGWTSWAQSSYGDGHTYGESYNCKPSGRSTACTSGTGPAPGEGKEGVFTKHETTGIRTDGGGGGDTGHRNIFDTKVALTNNSSEDEIRVVNRLIKVWKRIA